jgi:release factor glutamine methyltransferase
MNKPRTPKELLDRILEILGGKEFYAQADEILKAAASNFGKSAWHSLYEDDNFLKLVETLAFLHAAGIPVAYIEGERVFMGLNLKVKPGVFIPRQETELLVEFASRKIKEKFEGEIHILDIGTGTGAIALALAKIFPDAAVLGIDVNPGAVELSRLNAKLNGIVNASFRNLDFRDFLSGKPEDFKFHAVLSNPPYVGEFERAFLPGSVRFFEPEEALYGGMLGTEFYEILFSNLKNLLIEGGLFFFEIGFNQKDSVEEIGSKHGYRVSFWRDYSGIDRIAYGSYE